jgi:hypothetical protein
MELSKYERMIAKEAWKCFRSLPSRYYTIEELIQEGRLVFAKLRRRKLKRSKATFATILTRSLQNRYRDIIRGAYREKRRHEVVPAQLEDLPDVTRPTAERMLIVKEFIDYLMKVNPELADFFLNGPTEELEKFSIHRHMVRMRAGCADSSRISKGCVEEFFGLSFKRLWRSFNVGKILRRDAK